MKNLYFFLIFIIIISCEKADPKSSSKEITGQPELIGVTNKVSFDNNTNTYLYTVPYNTNLTTLSLNIPISPLATISPNPATPRDFTNPVTFTVVAEDGSSKTYIFKVISEVLNLPIANFTFTRNQDGSINLINSSTDATGFEWYVENKLVSTNKEISNLRIDTFSNWYYINKREPKIEGKTNVAANGNYKIVLKAINTSPINLSVNRNNEKEINIEIKDGITIINDAKMGVKVWDEAGVNFDGYSYVDSKNAQLKTMVTFWNKGPEYEKGKSMTAEKLKTLGYNFQAQVLENFLVALQKSAKGQESSLTMDYPMTLADWEKYENIVVNGLIISGGSMVFGFSDEKNTILNVGTGLKGNVKFKDYFNCDIPVFTKEGEMAYPTLENEKLRQEIINSQGVNIEFLTSLPSNFNVGGLSSAKFDIILNNKNAKRISLKIARRAGILPDVAEIEIF